MSQLTPSAASGSILCLSGHDPCGGAGIQADIETINSLGGHAACLITCLTVQDSRGLQALQPVDAGLLAQQATLLMDDLSIRAVKLGALGSAGAAELAAALIRRLRSINPALPVVLDPVLSAGGGGQLSDRALLSALRSTLLPLITLCTPNHAELQALSPANQASELVATGCQWLLLTGTDAAPADAPVIQHHLYGQSGLTQVFDCPRLPESYHGSGCTLAAALSFYLATGHTVTEALPAALAYTQQCLEDARPLGQGQWFPQRHPPRS